MYIYFVELGDIEMKFSIKKLFFIDIYTYVRYVYIKAHLHKICFHDIYIHLFVQQIFTKTS